MEKCLSLSNLFLHIKVPFFSLNAIETFRITATHNIIHFPLRILHDPLFYGLRTYKIAIYMPTHQFHFLEFYSYMTQYQHKKYFIFT